MEGIYIKGVFRISVILIVILNIVGCGQRISSTKNEEIKQNNDTVEQEEKIEIPSTEKIIDTLCSDDFGGRLAGSDGDEKAEQYISGILNDLNLESVFAGQYYEPYTQEVFKTYGITNENEPAGNKEVHNLVGVIKGNDSTKAVILSAHFDHVGYQHGKIIRGALDNASGVATLVRIADILKKESENKTFNQDIIFAFFDGEEEGLRGSKYFVNEIKKQYTNIYDINIDCIGGKQAGKISLNNKSKISDKLTEAIKETFKDNNMDYSNVELKGATSDHRSFERSGIPNIFIGQDNLKPYVHKETDTPDTLNFGEIDKVADVVSKFIEKNDGRTFKD